MAAGRDAARRDAHLVGVEPRRDRLPVDRRLERPCVHAGAGVDPRSLEASIDGRTVTARLVANEVRISTRGVASGRHRVRLSVADYQETRNMENVARILPNTRVVTASVTVRRPAS